MVSQFTAICQLCHLFCHHFLLHFIPKMWKILETPVDKMRRVSNFMIDKPHQNLLMYSYNHSHNFTSTPAQYVRYMVDCRWDPRYALDAISINSFQQSIKCVGPVFQNWWAARVFWVGSGVCSLTTTATNINVKRVPEKNLFWFSICGQRCCQAICHCHYFINNKTICCCFHNPKMLLYFVYF